MPGMFTPDYDQLRVTFVLAMVPAVLVCLALGQVTDVPKWMLGALTCLIAGAVLAARMSTRARVAMPLAALPRDRVQGFGKIEAGHVRGVVLSDAQGRLDVAHAIVETELVIRMDDGRKLTVPVGHLRLRGDGAKDSHDAYLATARAFGVKPLRGAWMERLSLGPGARVSVDCPKAGQAYRDGASSPPWVHLESRPDVPMPTPRVRVSESATDFEAKMQSPSEETRADEAL